MISEAQRTDRKGWDELAAGLHKLNEVSEQDITVPLTEAEGSVADFASVMVDDEARRGALIVLVGAHRRAQLLEEFVISPLPHSMQRGTHVIQHAHNAGGRFALDQIAHNFVVEVVNGLPFDSLLDVLLL